MQACVEVEQRHDGAQAAVENASEQEANGQALSAVRRPAGSARVVVDQFAGVSHACSLAPRCVRRVAGSTTVRWLAGGWPQSRYCGPGLIFVNAMTLQRLRSALRSVIGRKALVWQGDTLCQPLSPSSSP